MAKTWTLTDTGERRVPRGEELYLYLPTGTIHNWENFGSETGETDGSKFAILSVTPPGMTTQTALRRVPALYEMEPIGQDGSLQAVSVVWFCSEACRDAFTPVPGVTVERGMDGEWIDGTVCDKCGKPLTGVAQ